MKIFNYRHAPGAVFAILVCASISQVANATVHCNAGVANITLPLPASITIPSNTASGTPLTPWINSAAGRIYNGCTASDTSTTFLQARATGSSTSKTVVDGGITYTVYATNINGVGMILASRDRGGTAQGINVNTTHTDLIKGWSTFWDTSFSVRFYATGDPIVSGTLNAGTVGESSVTEKSSGTRTIPVPLMIGSTQVVGQTCTVNADSKNINVPLGNVRKSDFSVVGSTAGNAIFNIHLNCTAGIKVFMTLTDGNALGNTSNILNLTPGTGSATGVGIQIKRGGVPISFGPDSPVAGNVNQISLGTAAGGPIEASFTASYIQKDSVITGGTANGITTFTMSYQ